MGPRGGRAILLSLVCLGSWGATAPHAEARAAETMGDDAIVAVQDQLLGWLGSLMQWAGIRDYKLVGFQLTPTDDPGKWTGGFVIREEGCAVDRLVEGEWFYRDDESERYVGTQMVVTRTCDGRDRHVTLMWKYGLARLDGAPAPRYTVGDGAYAAVDPAGCRHDLTGQTGDEGRLSALTIRNGCDGTVSVFGCRDNWCSGPDFLTQIQVTGDDRYVVHLLARHFEYRRVGL